MSESGSSDQERELLINTRQRRSNAGNKLQKLLEQELEDLKSRTQVLDEDEIDLLFKEDEEDEDFKSEGDSSADGDHEEQNGLQDEEIGSDNASKSETVEDEDVMFSESSSEENGSDEDEDAGEKELMRQERIRKKRAQKLNRRPQVIKRKLAHDDDKVELKKKKSSFDTLNADTLLLNTRRTSSRASVVQNKLKVYEKLSQAEEKRKMIRERLKQTKEKEEVKELTQEDRMRIALETEQFNLLSLNKYKEQEVSKKNQRLAMQQRQKMKFKPNELIISEITTQWEVIPIMEIEDTQLWKEMLDKRNKKRKKYPKKPKKKVEEELIQNNDGSLNTAKMDDIKDSEGSKSSEETKVNPKEEAKSSEDNVLEVKSDPAYSISNSNAEYSNNDVRESERLEGPQSTATDDSATSISTKIEPKTTEIDGTEQHYNSSAKIVTVTGTESDHQLDNPVCDIKTGTNNIEGESNDDTKLNIAIDSTIASLTKKEDETKHVNEPKNVPLSENNIQPNNETKPDCVESLNNSESNDISEGNTNVEQVTDNEPMATEEIKNVTGSTIKLEYEFSNEHEENNDKHTDSSLVHKTTTNDVNIEREDSKTGLFEREISHKLENHDQLQLQDTNDSRKFVRFDSSQEVDILDGIVAEKNTVINNPKIADVSEDTEVKSELPLNEENKIDSSHPENIYEGPNQLVSKNFVTAYYVFQDNFKDSLNDILFGKDWSGYHRALDVERIFTSKLSEENSDVNDSNTQIKPNLNILENFPSFGEFDKKVVQEVDDKTVKDLEIKIKTPVPTGIFLPSGMRKKCLINNRECHYFDPKNGVPYSDVEAYKIIQELQSFNTDAESSHLYKWYGFGNGGIYLDANEKPATGVPEGF
ncbi:Vacuolar protein sorting-associated protein 72 [Nakaseomyces bracarensis]|uniref:Vacuolar protein sorting-associated protein 72 n=1 Tax=Nakaseomyces bracarensis TaxID=273131 RepID=A0ABR4NX40_9SACH